MKIATGPTRRQGLRRLAVLTAGSGAASVLGAVGIVFVLPGTAHHTTTTGTKSTTSTQSRSDDSTTTTTGSSSTSSNSTTSTNTSTTPTVTQQAPVATSGGS